MHLGVGIVIADELTQEAIIDAVVCIRNRDEELAGPLMNTKGAIREVEHQLEAPRGSCHSNGKLIASVWMEESCHKDDACWPDMTVNTAPPRSPSPISSYGSSCPPSPDGLYLVDPGLEIDATCLICGDGDYTEVAAHASIELHD